MQFKYPPPILQSTFQHPNLKSKIETTTNLNFPQEPYNTLLSLGSIILSKASRVLVHRVPQTVRKVRIRQAPLFGRKESAASAPRAQ